jgi:hypothetical protein
LAALNGVIIMTRVSSGFSGILSASVMRNGLQHAHLQVVDGQCKLHHRLFLLLSLSII